MEQCVALGRQQKAARIGRSGRVRSIPPHRPCLTVPPRGERRPPPQRRRRGGADGSRQESRRARRGIPTTRTKTEAKTPRGRLQVNDRVVSSSLARSARVRSGVGVFRDNAQQAVQKEKRKPIFSETTRPPSAWPRGDASGRGRLPGIYNTRATLLRRPNVKIREYHDTTASPKNRPPTFITRRHVSRQGRAKRRARPEVAGRGATIGWTPACAMWLDAARRRGRQRVGRMRRARA